MAAMDRNVRWLGFGSVLRATGQSLIYPYFSLFLRNVLGVPFLEVGLLLTISGVVPLLVVPFAGLLTDRVGRRRVFLLAMTLEATSVLLTAEAMNLRSIPALVVLVTLLGTMGTIGGPAISAYVADFSQGHERTRGFTWIRVGWNVGFTVGVLSGGVLIGFFGFVIVGVMAGAALLVGTAFVAVFLEPSPYDLRLRSLGAIPVGTALPPRAGSVRDSLQILRRDRAFLALCAGVALVSLSVGQWGVTFPLYVNSVLKIPYAILGLGLSLNGILVVFGQPPTTRAARGHRHTGLLIAGVGLYAAGFLLLASFALFSFALVAAFFAAVFVLTMGENVESIPGTTLPSNLAPPTEIGSYNGAFSAVTGAGYTLAPALGGLVLGLTANPLAVWSLLMLPAIPGVLLIGIVARRLPRAANLA
jgi:MFS family permease